MTPEKEAAALQVICDVAELYGITVAEIKSCRRFRKLADSRAVICHILCTQCKFSYSEVARMLNRTHATIINSVKNAEEWIKVPNINPEGANAINKLTRKNNYKQRWKKMINGNIYGK